VIQTIQATLMDRERTTGKAAQVIQEAEQERERIVLETQERVKTFEKLLAQYVEHKELLRQRLLMDMLQELFSQPGVKKWFLPPGAKQIILWLNPDPKDIKEAQERRARKKVGG